MSIVDLDQRDGEDVVLQGRRFRINLDSDYQRDAWVEVLGGVLEALDERCAQRTDINACMPVFVYLPYFVAEDWSRNTSTQLAGTRLNTPSASLTAVMRAGDAVCGTQQFESCTEHALRLVAQASSHNYPASDRNLRRGREYLWQLCFNTAYQGRASACSSGARAYSDRGNPSTENAHRLIALYDEGCKAGRVDACQEAFYIYRDGRYGLSRNRQAAIEMVRFVWRYRGTWPGAEGWARAAFSDMGVSVPAD